MSKMLNFCVLSPPSQRSFTEAVKLYDKGDFGAAIVVFEEALVEYYRADVECRALCQWPQKFEGYDYLRYRYSLYEVISGRTAEPLCLEKLIFFLPDCYYSVRPVYHRWPVELLLTLVRPGCRGLHSHVTKSSIA